MSANTVLLPDGQEASGALVMCEECHKPVSEHSCNGGVSGVSPAPVVSTRSTGPRKEPQARPPCPHCGGAIHFSMPGGLQNVECAMRQYYIDKGEIADAYERLPIYGLDELKLLWDWAQTLKTPLTYGRMESAAGGPGTYAAQRPPSEKRARKQTAAAPGERIEDLAGEVTTPTHQAAPPTGEVTVKRGRGRPRKIRTTEQPVEQPVLMTPESTREERRARIRQSRAVRPEPVVAPIVDPVALTPQDEEEVLRRRAERRARIQGVRAR